MQAKRVVTLMVILFALLAGGLIPKVCAAPDALPCTETTISVLTPDSDQSLPLIWEDRIVFLDNRDGKMDLWLYEVLTGKEERINGFFPVSDGVPPSISGDLVVWESPDNSEKIIWLCNASSGERTILANITGPGVSWPVIYGRLVAFSSSAGASIDLHVLDLDSGEITVLENGTADTDDLDPDIYGNWIIWQGIDNSQGDSDIYVWETGMPAISDLTPGTPEIFQSSPDIDENFAVWEGYDIFNSTYDIYLYNLSTGEAILLTPDTPFTDEMSPSISGDRVVWQRINETSWVSEVVLYSISSQETVVISQGSHGEQSRPSVWGNRVVWAEMDPLWGTFDVRMATCGISAPQLVPDFDANGTIGSVPLVVQFQDLSTGGATGWWWDFGDGGDSKEQHPLHVYNVSGTYSVTLIVSTAHRREGIIAENLISADSAPVADFHADPIDGAVPLLVGFTDDSAGDPLNWSWEFGDGSTSTEQNPQHIYTAPGFYNVTLTTGNDFGDNTLEKEGYIAAMQGETWEMIFPRGGISLDELGGVQTITMNTSFLGGTLKENDTYYEFSPPSSHRLYSVGISTPPGMVFSSPNTDILEGEVAGVNARSIEFCDSIQPLDWALSGLMNLERYPVEGILTLSIWPGATPEDYQQFRRIAMQGNTSDPNWTFNVYGDVPWVGYTARFKEENTSIIGPATLAFGVNSTWIEQNAWRRIYEVNTTPEKARIYLDSQFLGYSPLVLDENVAGGVHILRVEYPGYTFNETTIALSHKWESIRIIHLDGQGLGDVLETTYLGRDESRNLDMFQAVSPGGLSTFGLVSTSRAGSPIQVFYLILSKFVSGEESGGATAGGGGGGGGGYGGSGSVSSAAPAPTAVPTESGPVEEMAAMAPAGIPGAPNEEAAPVTAAPTISPDENPLPDNPATVLPSVVGYTLIRNVAIVFGVVLVAALLILRWRRGGDES